MKTFSDAFKGLGYFFRNELNAKIHSFITVLVFIAGFYLKLNINEWGLIIFAIALVFTAEIINTAIEKIMDMIQPDKDNRVRNIKDIAAGAVLFASIMSAIIGLIVFIPHLM